jgi:Fe-S cluster assembly ATP-binding protein
MLKIDNLNIAVWDKQILSWINIVFEQWKNYLIVWKNWSWKSTLANFLMGNPEYTYISGGVTMNWKNLLSMEVNEKSQAGLFLSFQDIPEIEWISVTTYLRTIYSKHLKSINPSSKGVTPFLFRKLLKKLADDLKIKYDLLERDLNVWFSWWEKRKIELLQALLLKPKYLILDEIDSGLDVDAYKDVIEIINSIAQEWNGEICIIVITHKFEITSFLEFDKVIVMDNGAVKEVWNLSILDSILTVWFKDKENNMK